MSLCRIVVRMRDLVSCRGRFSLLCLVLIFVAPTGAVAKTIEVRASSGAFRGEIDDGFAVFRGIPYAQPPVGELRWRPPVRVGKHAGVLDATEFRSVCIQRREGGPSPGGFLKLNGVSWWRRYLIQAVLAVVGQSSESEDCLFLNVRAPEVAAEPLPVMVWLHGGGHQMGSGSFPAYNTNVLPKRGSVVVTINYRLGIFGFLAHPELSRESTHDVSGNYGMLDQVAALEWVRDNISAFGGDPNNVTIFGESAGAHSVGQLLASPLAAGLFHRAIAQSGSGAHQNLHLRKNAPGFASAESTGVEVADGRDLASLRAMNSSEISVLWRVDDGRTKAFHPCVDGWVLPKSVSETFARGEQLAVPLLVGSNSDEGQMFFGAKSPWRSPLPEVPGPITSVADYRERVTDAFGADAETILSYYAAGSDSEIRDAAQRLFGDSYFVGNGVFLAAAMRKVGQPAFLYYFSRPTPNTDYGALHAGEIDFVFDGARIFPEVDGDVELKSLVADYWVNFARSGDPNGPGRPQWSAYDSANPHWMVLDHEAGLAPIPNRELFEAFDRRRSRLAERTVSP